MVREVSWPMKNGGFTFFKDGVIMVGEAVRFAISVSVAVLNEPLEERLRVSCLGIRERDAVHEQASLGPRSPAIWY